MCTYIYLNLYYIYRKVQVNLIIHIYIISCMSFSECCYESPFFFRDFPLLDLKSFPYSFPKR